MAKEFARKFYNSTRWRKCAKAFAQSKLYVCEMCHNQTSKKINGDQRYIVHHKVPLTPNNIYEPYITCGWDNLMLLCIECHNKIHGKERRQMLFDDNGNLIGINEPKNN